MRLRRRGLLFALLLALGLVLLALVRIGRSTHVDAVTGDATQGPALSSRPRRSSVALSALRAAPAPSLFGKVRSEAGEALTKAQVCLSCVYPECGQLGLPSTSCVTSDEHGDYAWGSLASGVYYLTASASGFVATATTEGDATRLVVQAGESIRRDLILKPGGASLAGTVIDATGGPIPLARVQATQGDGAQVGVTVLSDEDGHFELTLRAGSVTLRAEAEGYASATQTAAAPNTQVELQLSPEASLTGSVVSALDGQPLADIEVTAFKHTPLMLVAGDGRALSAADGSFSIRGLSSGTFHVHARSAQWAGSAEHTISLGISEPGGPVHITARPAVAVSGSVQIARTSLPCSAGTLFLASADTTGAEPFAASSALSAEGTFRFSGVSPGTYALRVECRDALARSYPSLQVAEKDVAGLKLEVERGLVLSGRVLDASGRALSDRAVSIAPDEATASAEPSSAAARSDAHGGFSVKGLSPGAYRVTSGDDEQAIARVKLTAAHPETEITLVIASAGALRVFVDGMDERGGAALAVSVSSQFGEQRAQRSSDGSYLLRDLRAGLYTVTVGDGKGPSVSRQVQLADGQQLDTHLTVPKQRDVLSGRVVDGAGNPVSDAWVRASRSATSLYEGAPSDPVLTDAEGNFVLTQLARSETYDVEAYVHDNARSVSRGLKPGQWVTLRLENDRKL